MNAISPRSKLKGKSPDLVVTSRAKVLMFGGSGKGKTWLALDFPDVFFIDAEKGATQKKYRDKLKASGGLYFGPEDGANSFEEVLGQIKALATEKHTRRTLVIDSVTKLFATEIAREDERLREAGKKNEFGADKKPAVKYMRQLCDWISRIDMNVILTAGAVAEWGMDDKGERVQIGETFDCWPRLEYELDLAICVFEAGPLRLGRVRKTRIAEFPKNQTFPWSYDEFANRYGREALEGESAPIVLATQDQIAEIDKLLSVVKLDEGTVDKWLAAANVSTWDEMSSERIAKAIEHIRSKINS